MPPATPAAICDEPYDAPEELELDEDVVWNLWKVLLPATRRAARACLVQVVLVERRRAAEAFMLCCMV